eukprot:5266920-Pleurochrysis_carterae.AAC.1
MSDTRMKTLTPSSGLCRRGERAGVAFCRPLTSLPSCWSCVLVQLVVLLSMYASPAITGETVPNATIHPIMKYTHDWKTFFDSDIYDSVEQVNTTRKFIVRKREDGGVLARTSVRMLPPSNALAFVAVTAFWYKPDSSHLTLYPTAKVNKGKPIEVVVNGERSYQHCTYEIEVFRSGCAQAHMRSDSLSVHRALSGPAGTPGIAPFAREVSDASKPRFGVDEARANVLAIMDAVRTLYPDARRKEWHDFFNRSPLSVRNIPADDIHPVKRDAVPPCSLRLPKNASLSNHLGRFAESITYHNPVSGTGKDKNKIRLAVAAAADISILQVGNIICVLPDEEYT